MKAKTTPLHNNALVTLNQSTGKFFYSS
ncbi:MAG: hypothetical protein JWQ57_431, partial [Mucilaginibacter sp.]|nr:hypothetical protein [Mucilaginibacter sp.]